MQTIYREKLNAVCGGLGLPQSFFRALHHLSGRELETLAWIQAQPGDNTWLFGQMWELYTHD